MKQRVVASSQLASRACVVEVTVCDEHVIEAERRNPNELEPPLELPCGQSSVDQDTELVCLNHG